MAIGKTSESEPDLGGLLLTERAGGVRFSLHAKPRASRSRIVGVREGALDLAVAAPPVDGAANDEIRSFLADMLDLPRRDVEIVSGSSGRSKIVEVALDVREVRLRLARALGKVVAR